MKLPGKLLRSGREIISNANINLNVNRTPDTGHQRSPESITIYQAYAWALKEQKYRMPPASMVLVSVLLEATRPQKPTAFYNTLLAGLRRGEGSCILNSMLGF